MSVMGAGARGPCPRGGGVTRRLAGPEHDDKYNVLHEPIDFFDVLARDAARRQRLHESGGHGAHGAEHIDCSRRSTPSRQAVTLLDRSRCESVNPSGMGPGAEDLRGAPRRARLGEYGALGGRAARRVQRVPSPPSVSMPGMEPTGMVVNDQAVRRRLRPATKRPASPAAMSAYVEGSGTTVTSQALVPNACDDTTRSPKFE